MSDIGLPGLTTNVVIFAMLGAGVLVLPGVALLAAVELAHRRIARFRALAPAALIGALPPLGLALVLAMLREMPAPEPDYGWRYRVDAVAEHVVLPVLLAALVLTTLWMVRVVRCDRGRP